MSMNQPGSTTAITGALQALMAPHTPRDRDAAEWDAASDVSKHHTDYAPKRFLFAEWDKIVPWFDFSPEALKIQTTTTPELFGKFRVAVLDYEGACAKQLEALAWSMRTLYRLRDKPGANLARIDAAAEPIAEVLHSGWGVPDTFLRDSLKRDWAQRFTRRYDLLPRVWREI